MRRCKSLGSLKSFICIAAILGPVPCVFHILRSLELTPGRGCNLMATRSQVFFSFLSSLRAQEFTVENGMDDDCDILVYWQKILHFLGLPSACNAGDQPGFDPWLSKIPWSRKWQPTPVCLPGEFHGQGSLVGYSPWGHTYLENSMDRGAWWATVHGSQRVGHN